MTSIFAFFLIVGIIWGAVIIFLTVVGLLIALTWILTAAAGAFATARSHRPTPKDD